MRAREELARRDAALAVRPAEHDLAVEREDDRGQLGGRVGVDDAADDRAAVAHRGMGDLAEGLGDERRGARDLLGALDGRLPRPRPDRQPAVVEADVVELVDVVDVDEVRRLGDAEVHQRHKTLTARQDARLLPGRRQHGDRLARARGTVVGERGRLHGSLLTPGCADGPTLMTTYARRGNCVRRPLFARRRAPRPIG